VAANGNHRGTREEHRVTTQNRSGPLAGLFPELKFAKFNRRQDRLLFFSLVDELVHSSDIVVDLGAGRNRLSEYGPHLQRISQLKGRCARVIGVDVDPVVLNNDALDEAHVISPGGPLPLADASVDLIYSYAVLEHVEEPAQLVAEVARVLRPGGWFCAWTPNKWGYVGVGARLVPNRFHARLLATVQPGSRGEKDVFPVRYRMNTLQAVRRAFGEHNFEHFSFTYNAQPSYNFGSALVARIWLLYMTLAPSGLAQSLMVFERKSLGAGT
jgi:SAM-dependent methyltransferase